MLIRYTGMKPIKRIEYGSKTFIFEPTCEVTDAESLKFLLHPSRRDLFVIEKGEKAKEERPEVRFPAEPPTEKAKPKRRKKKKE